MRADNQKIYLLGVIIAVLTAGCATQRNTARSRWWHSFTTRYNVYYNGAQAYIAGSLAKEQGNTDDYTTLIPLFTVGNASSRTLGGSDFDLAIEKSKKAIKTHSIKRRPQWNRNRRKTDKDREWLNRKEYNPFLWKAWLLMGKSQFMKGDFDDAAATFRYMCRLYATQPGVYCRARAWLARCYIYSGRIYDAEDIIVKTQREPIHWTAVREWDYTYTDYFISLKQYDKAVTYLKKSISHEIRHKQRARMYYLLGQLESLLGRRDEACSAFKHVVRLHPAYDLAFHARVAMTEVMAAQGGESMVKRLRRMARQENNKKYSAQIHYAIGNIYLTRGDTTAAVSAYETGRKDSLGSGFDKGLLLVKLGDLYWQKERYVSADSCYTEASPLVGGSYRDKKRLDWRLSALKQLVPNLVAIRREDSLQTASRLTQQGDSARLTPQKLNESNLKLADALFQGGVAAKDRIGNLNLSERLLTRLTDSFDGYEHRDEALYHIFLLNLRRGDKERKDRALARLKQDFPSSQWTLLLSDPDYEYNARYGTHIEDSLYAATYEAFKAGRYAEVIANASLSASRFPMGDNRDKFLFVGGMTKLNVNDCKGCVADMQAVISQYPKSGVRPMAETIVKGIADGRQIHSSGSMLDDVWNRRMVTAKGQDSADVKHFTAERNVKHSFLWVFNPDSVERNKLLFELARYNFTNFLVRSFDIKTDTLGGLERMIVSGFLNYDEALQYARMLYKNDIVRQLAANCRAIIISEENLSLLGTHYSYKDYDAFYEREYRNMEVSKDKLLYSPESIEYLPSSESTDNVRTEGGNPNEGTGVAKSEEVDSRSATDDDKEAVEIEQPSDSELEDEYYDLDGF